MANSCVLFCILLLAIAYSEACIWSSGQSRWRPTSPSETKQEKIARIADKYINSTKWSKESRYGPGSGENKCNWFVADVIRQAGASVPLRHWWGGIIGAGEWAKPNSTYLTGHPCWTNVEFPGQKGDVLGCDYVTYAHVGIVTDYNRTTYAGTYQIKKTDWGYRPPGAEMYCPSPTFWRYTCK